MTQRVHNDVLAPMRTARRSPRPDLAAPLAVLLAGLGLLILLAACATVTHHGFAPALLAGP
jgi:hypothetical protein